MNAGSVTPAHRILAELRRIPTYQPGKLPGCGASATSLSGWRRKNSLDRQRGAVPAGDEVAVDRPLQHLLPLGDREFPERLSPLRQRVAAPDVVHQDVEPARFGTDPCEELLHFGLDRVVGADGDAPVGAARRAGEDGHLVAERLLRLAALWVEAGIRGLPGQRWGSRGSITSMIYPPGFCVCTPSGLSRHIDIPA